MARIRTIKPEFFTSEDIVELTPLARLLYIALWCEADREGRMAWKPRTFKMRYLPADDCNIADLCTELTCSGLVVLYGSELEYGYIPSFQAHQHLNPREAESQLPAPDDDASSTRAPRVPNASARDSDAQGGREGKGKEGKGKEGSNTPAKPDGIADELWADFLKLRRAKKAPVTTSALTTIEKEAQKAGIGLAEALETMCARGWTGFKADWVTKDDILGQRQSFGDRDAQRKADRMAEFMGTASRPSNVIDVTDTTRRIA